MVKGFRIWRPNFLGCSFCCKPKLRKSVRCRYMVMILRKLSKSQVRHFFPSGLRALGKQTWTRAARHTTSLRGLVGAGLGFDPALGWGACANAPAPRNNGNHGNRGTQMWKLHTNPRKLWKPDNLRKKKIQCFISFKIFRFPWFPWFRV